MLSLILGGQTQRSVPSIARSPDPLIVLPEAADRSAVNYSTPFGQMVADGRYDDVDYRITKSNFPIKGEGLVPFEFGYRSIRHPISSELALRKISVADRANPWMPAAAEHAFLHGALFPKRELTHRFVSLAAITGEMDERQVIIQGSNGPRRFITLIAWIGDWDSSYTFLCVRPIRPR